MKYLIIAAILFTSCEKAATKSAQVQGEIEIVDAYRITYPNKILDSVRGVLRGVGNPLSYLIYCGVRGNVAPSWDGPVAPLGNYSPVQAIDSVSVAVSLAKTTYRTDLHMIITYPNGDTLASKPYTITKFITR